MEVCEDIRVYDIQEHCPVGTLPLFSSSILLERVYYVYVTFFVLTWLTGRKDCTDGGFT